MNPAATKTELPPSTRLRKAIFGGSLKLYLKCFGTSLSRIFWHARGRDLKQRSAAFAWGFLLVLAVLAFVPEAASQCSSSSSTAPNVCVPFRDSKYDFHKGPPSRWVTLTIQSDFNSSFNDSFYWSWPTTRTTKMPNPDPDGITVVAHPYGDSHIAITHDERLMSFTGQQEISAYVSTVLPGFSPTQQILDLSVPIEVRGGAFDTKILPIRAKTIIVSASSEASVNSPCPAPGTNARRRWTEQHLIVALGWGIGPSDDDLSNIFDVPVALPRQVHHFILIDIRTSVSDGTCDTSVISLDDAERQTLNGRTAERYLQDILNHYLIQLVSSNPAPLLGAVPQWLFLYDFSATSTINPTNAPYVNQYDAGDAFGLPVRFAPLASHRYTP